MRSLLLQTWTNLHIIVVDDRSEDGTAANVQALRLDPLLLAAHHNNLPLTLVQGTALPEGWLGKNHANFQGACAAKALGAAWLLFTDADTVHSPDALATALATGRAYGAALVTFSTGLDLQTVAEKVFLTNITLAIGAIFPTRYIHDPRCGTALANGQFILIRRDVYDRVGAHAAIRASVCDDLELARAVKSSGFKLRVVRGQNLVRARMYTSFSGIWWGFSKNMAYGIGGPARAAVGALFALLLVLPFFLLPFAPWLPAPVIFSCAAAVILALAQRVYAFVWFFPRISPLWALSLPVAYVVMAGILCHSACRIAAGRGSRWKGREYPDAR
ncbi:MAG: hypothetical protein A2285_03185 [Elusimicrobia bacterium RIFOXYA12_FULL_57_11]|nr:MAG: hypothetical protein A2285_03185 [Elusimicrobia bacterium RIFOXYA12_FULL_57_11]